MELLKTGRVKAIVGNRDNEAKLIVCQPTEVDADEDDELFGFEVEFVRDEADLLRMMACVAKKSSDDDSPDLECARQILIDALRAIPASGSA